LKGVRSIGNGMRVLTVIGGRRNARSVEITWGVAEMRRNF